MKRGAIFLLMWLLWFKVAAQELNIGVHASPTISIPIGDRIGQKEPYTTLKPYTINASGGININIRIKDLCIETGASARTHTVAFRLNASASYNNIGSSSSVSARTLTRAYGHVFSLPFLLGYKLHHHEASTVYDVFGILGASYDNYTLDAYSYESGTGNQATSTYIFTSQLNPYPAEGYSTNWVNIIAGFKIHAILRHVGLVEYGMRYSYPLSNAGQYKVNTVVSNNNYGSVFNGDFYPRLSFIDFHITYYFLNLEAGTGLKRYRYK